MTPKEQNIAIAEWRYGNPPKFYNNYHGDLNAIHEAVVYFSKRQKIQFSSYLRKAVSHYHVCWEILSIEEKNYVVENATAPHRCEAFLRTIGKWKAESSHEKQ